jgi:hypothetical protein
MDLGAGPAVSDAGLVASPSPPSTPLGDTGGGATAAVPAPPPGAEPQVEAAQEEPGAEIPRWKLGEKEYSQEEAATEWAAQQNRLQGADRTTAAYRERAEQAIKVAQAQQELLRRYGLLDESGRFLTRSPEDFAAQRAGQPAQPEYKFALPDVLDFGEDGMSPEDKQAATNEFFAGLESVAEQKGLRFAFGIFADHLNRWLGRYHSEFSNQFLPRVFDQHIGPWQPFMQSVQETAQRANFLAAMKEQTNPQGQPVYPELQNPDSLPRLIEIMDDMQARGLDVLSPEGFRYAMYSLRATLPARAPSAAPAPARSVPPVVLEATQSGVPRPKPNGGLPDASKRLLHQPGVLGGIDFGF